MITILKISEKGARLITDTHKTAWISPTQFKDKNLERIMRESLDTGEKIHCIPLAKVSKTTDKAIALHNKRTGTDVWFPKSQVFKQDDNILIPDWLMQSVLK